jgi:hypothetical protein
VDWLCLLAFSDRPQELLEVRQRHRELAIEPRHFRRLMSVLHHAPRENAETILFGLAEQDPRFLGEYSWLSAVTKEPTPSAAMRLVNLASSGVFSTRQLGGSTAYLARELASLMNIHSAVRQEIYARYDRSPAVAGRTTLEQAIVEAADPTGLILLVHHYIAERRHFDSTLHRAAENAVTTHDPIEGWANAYEVRYVAVPRLRAELLELAELDQADGVAAACLNAIDELRDVHGVGDTERRHPDLESGRRWPIPSA